MPSYIVANIASTATSITATPNQPITVWRRDRVYSSMILALWASIIITVMTGTAITPLIWADHSSALIGSSGAKLSAAPPTVARAMMP